MPPGPIDDYVAGVEPSIRPVLERLRRVVVDEIGPCEEVLSYSMPGFRLPRDNAYGVGAKVVCGFAAWRHGGSFYPHSGAVLPSFAAETAAYAQTAGALHFTAEQALPDDLVRRLVRAKIALLQGREPRGGR